MNRSLVKFLLLLLILSGKLFAAAETPSVELHGNIKSLKPAVENESRISFYLTLELEFINKSDRPIFLSKRKPWETNEYIATSIENLSNKEYIYWAGGSAANDISPKWEKYRRKLDRPTPSKKYFRTILPNNGWRFEIEIGIDFTKIVAQNGFIFDGRNKINWSEIKSSPELWIQIKVPFWFSNIEAINDRDEKRFGEKLRKQWERDGYLWLDDLKTAPILLDFKPALR